MEFSRFLDPDLQYHVYVKDTHQFQKTHDTYDHWALFIVEEGAFNTEWAAKAEGRSRMTSCYARPI